MLSNTSIYSQNENQRKNREFENVSKKIEKNQIPKIVIDAYYKEYKTVTGESWYGYPLIFDYENWYDLNPNLYTKISPKYYIVEFNNEKNNYRIIYDSLGKKISTYKNINTKIQKAIAKSIVNSKYKDWKIIKEKEEIFRDLDLDKIIIYKIEVQHKKSKHFLFYNAAGILIKDIEIEP